MTNFGKAVDLALAFSEAEANLSLEGMRPTPFGLSLKERILHDEIMLEQAEQEFSAHYAQIPITVA
jgi:hypothetical protein